MQEISFTDLILNADGSVFHLHLKPGQVAENVILVGDPNRVPIVSKFFSTIEHKVSNREFITHTGVYNEKRISVISTGIGTDNIDIVVNELDALFNLDLQTRQPKKEHTTLNLIRVGTSGSIHPEIAAGFVAISAWGMGLDNLMNYYRREESAEEMCLRSYFLKNTGWNTSISRPYFVQGSKKLLALLEEGMVKGITVTAPGFYGPQGRTLRLPLADPEMMEKLRTFSYQGDRIINFEMETSALYGLSSLLGHEAITLCALIANRASHDFLTDHSGVIENFIQRVLKRLSSGI
jgi:uridine phosphorylase